MRRSQDEPGQSFDIVGSAVHTVEAEQVKPIRVHARVRSNSTLLLLKQLNLVPDPGTLISQRL